MTPPFEYGILLPHFGTEAKRERIVESAVAIEDYGFDSVWVRDHLVFHPHEYEDQNRTFVDPIVALSAIAGVTKKITLAMGSLIPHRNPIHTALLLGSLDFIAGPGRLLVGWGLGTYPHEFEVIGMGEWDRREVLPEQIEIQRQLWTGESVDFEGKFYNFDDVQIAPVPRGDVPVWYCGTSLAAVRRTVEYCDGWIPGRMPQQIFAERMQRMRRLADEAGRTELPATGIIPWVSPAPTVEEASKAFDVDQLISAAIKKGYKPEGKDAPETLADLGGGIIAGPKDVIVETVRGYQAVGVNHTVFDLRARFQDWEYCIEYLGSEVLPLLRAGDKTGA